MRTWLLLCSLAFATSSHAETIRLSDGTTLDVEAFEIRDRVVIFTTIDGELRSIPRELFAGIASGGPSVSRLIERAGLKRLIDDIAGTAQHAASGLGDGIVDAETLTFAMKEGFARERLYRVALDTFLAHATGLKVAAALEWLESPQARSMRRVELAPDDASFREFLHGLSETPPGLKRVELAMRLDRATGTTRAAIEMQMALLGALVEGIAPPDGASDEQRVEALLTGVRETLASETESRLRLSLLYTYRDVSDDELARYVAHLESEQGAWVGDILMRSVFAALSDGARRAGEIMARRIADKGKIAA